MGCSNPLHGWQTWSGEISFTRVPDPKRELDLPCGQCAGCRLERSRQWAIRCVHESTLHDESCFVTLTYSPEKLPPGRTLVHRDFQLFLKRVRQSVRRKEIAQAQRLGLEPKHKGVRFYMCGEYGEEGNRPHYHALLFGYRPTDGRYFGTGESGADTFSSASLDALWGLGFTTFGECTFESAAYTARYVMKKINGAAQADHYRYVDADGVVTDRRPDYACMSKKPGIGHGWFTKYMSDVYPHGKVVVGAVECAPPKYYDRLYSLVDAGEFDHLLERRAASGALRSEHHTIVRRRVADTVLKARISNLKRKI